MVGNGPAMIISGLNLGIGKKAKIGPMAKTLKMGKMRLINFNGRWNMVTTGIPVGVCCFLGTAKSSVE